MGWSDAYSHRKNMHSFNCTTPLISPRSPWNQRELFISHVLKINLLKPLFLTTQWCQWLWMELKGKRLRTILQTVKLCKSRCGKKQARAQSWQTEICLSTMNGTFRLVLLAHLSQCSLWRCHMIKDKSSTRKVTVDTSCINDEHGDKGINYDVPSMACVLIHCLPP